MLHDDPNSSAVREQLAKLLASRAFRSAESQRRFLSYAVEEALAGRGQNIKEYLIGVEVFRRGESFDPRLDPIVRTQARKLRAKLDKYYETEGAADSLRIDFPKGAYLPSFHTLALPQPAETPPAPPPVSIPQHATASQESPGLSLFFRRWRMAISLLILAAAGVASAALFLLRHGPAENAGTPSLLVMPFVNISDNEADDFLGDGLAEDLIDSLTQVPGLKVVARNSAIRFKGQNLPIKEIARTLQVRSVLEGVIRKSGDRLRITAQLVDASEGYQLWSGSYDRESRDVRAIRREIAQSIAGALGISLTGRPREYRARNVPLRTSPNANAYRSYVRGLYFWNKLSVDSLKTAIQHFEDAIEEDPSFAPAYTALADSYVMAPQVATFPHPEVVSTIKAAAGKALELDSSLGHAHIDLAICAEYEFDWETAERHFKKGLELDPGNAVAHLWYAKLLALTGRRQEVLKQRLIAADLDPVSPYTVQALGGYFSVMGNYDQAIEHFDNALQLEPGFGLAHQGLGIAYLLKHEPARAIEELQLANRLMKGPRRLGLLGYVFGMSGRASEARKVLRDLLDQSKRESVPALAIAHVYIGMGDKDRAFEWMGKAVDQKDLSLTLQWDSLYDSLRSDPRYTDLLRRMRLG